MATDAGAGAERQYLWWQRGIIYQIYPRSFMDSNGDGIGDLPGITSKLDYLQTLGIDAIWISPIFPSPMADHGYDVSDYTDIHPIFGTLDDFDKLLKAAHQRNLKVILDWVPNHTSNEHPWFLESRSSRDNPKRDWYIWRDPAPDGGPPNNWLSHFGGIAWTWDEQTGQYYNHSFLKEQPDLNWRNPEVKQAMFNTLRFWFDRGVDGFRVDVIWHLIKDEQLRDNPENPNWQPGDSPYQQLIPLYSADRPEVHQVIREMRAVFDEYDERVLIGEIYLPVERLLTYYGEDDNEIQLPYNFQLILLPWEARTVSAAIDTYEAEIPTHGWPNWVLGNHDRHRIASRVGPAQARVAAMLLLTLRGTPTIYYGDEIGMQDVEIPPELIQDPQEIRVPGIGLGRDPVRTPIQWDASPNAGFTVGTPWLPVAGDYQTVNIATERNDSDSMLTLHRRLIALRSAERVLEVGHYRSIPTHGDMLAYLRELNGERLLIALNLGDASEVFTARKMKFEGRIALSTHLDREGEEVRDSIELRPNEGMVVRLSN